MPRIFVLALPSLYVGRNIASGDLPSAVAPKHEFPGVAGFGHETVIHLK